MTQPLNTAKPPTNRGNRPLLIALIIAGITIIALLILLIGRVSAGDDSTASDPEKVETTAGSESTGSTTQELAAPDPQIKELVESQWRLEEGDPLAVGELDADLIMQIYSDFQCGYCALSAVETEPKLASYIEDGTLRIEYHNLPVLGDASVLAAQGALAAGQQGKYLEYHDYIFERLYHQDPVSLTEEGIIAIAKEIGVPDIEQFTADFSSADTVAAVQESRAEGTDKLGITGTPAFIIGYSYIPGYVSIDTMESKIAAELARPTP